MESQKVKKCRVAIFPAGSEIGLEIASALKGNKHFELVGLTSTNDHSEFVYDELYYIGNVGDPDFLLQLNTNLNYCGKYSQGVDLFFPAHDLVLDFVAENHDKINCKIVMHDPDTIKLCRSKTRTYELFPEISPKITVDDSDPEYPLFAKLDRGFGSVGSYKVTGYYLLNKAFEENMLVCEYLPGDEYTVDCFTKDGDFLVFMPRKRARIKNGIAVRSETVKMNSIKAEKLFQMAEKILEKLQFDGAWFFQAKENKDGELKLLEIAPRIAGTSGLTRANGRNLPLLWLYFTMGSDVRTQWNDNKIKMVERALSSKYELDYEYDSVYIDFDDTLFIDDKVNTELMAFIYQCQNKNKNIYLITRNFGNVEGKLFVANISPKIFKEIIRVPNVSDKSDYVLERNAIFIDDSFKERKDVSLNCDIPVFDVSEVQCLLR